MFTTLTVSGFDIQVLWEKSKSVYPPHHINLFSIDGFRRLVERSGLNLVNLCTPVELDVDIVRNIYLEKSDIEDIEVKQAYERGMTPSETILKYAAENNIDLIVMDTHRKQGVRLLLGSILDEVVRSAPCAVLAIHHKKNTEPKFALYSSQDIL